MGKLSYQPSANHRFSFSFNYNKTRNPYMFAGLYTRPEATFNTTIQAYAYNANWLWTLSPDTILEVRGFHLYRPTDYLSRPRASSITITPRASRAAARTTASRSGCAGSPTLP
jgi:hypothetical protein